MFSLLSDKGGWSTPGMQNRMEDELTREAEWPGIRQVRFKETIEALRWWAQIVKELPPL